MRVIVTGGAGFIGRHISRNYVSLGATVTILDSLATSNADGLPEGTEFLNIDIRDEQLPDLIESLTPQVIVHTAAQASVPRSMRDPVLDRSVNVEGTERVTEGALRVPGCRIVFLSTGGAIYGETLNPATEETLPQPKSYYGAHKYLAEKCLEFSGASYGIARLANVYGPGQPSDLEGGVMAIFAERMLKNEPVHVYGDGYQSRDFVHVTDVAEAVAVIAGSEQNDIWNVGSSSELTVRELIAEMQSAFDSHSTVEFLPNRVGDVRRSCLSIHKIHETLGWRPRIGLWEGLQSLREKEA